MAKILIVDDSPTETHKISTLLGKHGHSVLTADSGAAGIESARANLPDIVLMDIVMPGLNGFQATRELTKKGSTTSHIPVIIVSSKDQDTDRVWGERQGASGYLTKPVDEKTLISAVNGVLEEN